MIFHRCAGHCALYEGMRVVTGITIMAEIMLKFILNKTPLRIKFKQK